MPPKKKPDTVDQKKEQPKTAFFPSEEKCAALAVQALNSNNAKKALEEKLLNFKEVSVYLNKVQKLVEKDKLALGEGATAADYADLIKSLFSEENFLVALKAKLIPSDFLSQDPKSFHVQALKYLIDNDTFPLFQSGVIQFNKFRELCLYLMKFSKSSEEFEFNVYEFLFHYLWYVPVGSNIQDVKPISFEEAERQMKANLAKGAHYTDFSIEGVKRDHILVTANEEDEETIAVRPSPECRF